MPNKHKHYNLIMAWANGAKVQYLDFSGGWHSIDNPFWDEDIEHRIKPEPNPDIVLYAYSESCGIRGTHAGLTGAWDLKFFNNNIEYKPNLKLIYDGETNEFKSVEKI